MPWEPQLPSVWPRWASYLEPPQLRRLLQPTFRQLLPFRRLRGDPILWPERQHERGKELTRQKPEVAVPTLFPGGEKTQDPANSYVGRNPQLFGSGLIPFPNGKGCSRGQDRTEKAIPSPAHDLQGKPCVCCLVLCWGIFMTLHDPVGLPPVGPSLGFQLPEHSSRA